MTRSGAVFRRTAAVLTVMVLAILLGAGPASAHDVLISSNPADGTTINQLPSTVTFTFDQPVQNIDAVVALTGPDGVSHTSTQVTVLGSVVTGGVSGTAPGAYIAAFRIISADGHPVTGEVHFTVTGKGAGESVAPTTGPVAATRTSAALPAWAWVALGVAAVAMAAAVLLIVRRPTRELD